VVFEQVAGFQYHSSIVKVLGDHPYYFRFLPLFQDHGWLTDFHLVYQVVSEFLEFGNGVERIVV
jgi:hypothetical protein